VAAWDGGPIRKAVRRARGIRFCDTAASDGVEVLRRGAQVRAFVPGPVDDVPPLLSRLQVGGTELPDVGDPGPHVPGGSSPWRGWTSPAPGARGAERRLRQRRARRKSSTAVTTCSH